MGSQASERADGVLDRRRPNLPIEHSAPIDGARNSCFVVCCLVRCRCRMSLMGVWRVQDMQPMVRPRELYARVTPLA